MKVSYLLRCINEVLNEESFDFRIGYTDSPKTQTFPFSILNYAIYGCLAIDALKSGTLIRDARNIKTMKETKEAIKEAVNMLKTEHILILGDVNNIPLFTTIRDMELGKRYPKNDVPTIHLVHKDFRGLVVPEIDFTTDLLRYKAMRDLQESRHITNVMNVLSSGDFISNNNEIKTEKLLNTGRLTLENNTKTEKPLVTGKFDPENEMIIDENRNTGIVDLYNNQIKVYKEFSKGTIKDKIDIKIIEEIISGINKTTRDIETEKSKFLASLVNINHITKKIQSQIGKVDLSVRQKKPTIVHRVLGNGNIVRTTTLKRESIFNTGTLLWQSKPIFLQLKDIGWSNKVLITTNELVTFCDHLKGFINSLNDMDVMSDGFRANGKLEFSPLVILQNYELAEWDKNSTKVDVIKNRLLARKEIDRLGELFENEINNSVVSPKIGDLYDIQLESTRDNTFDGKIEDSIELGFKKESLGEIIKKYISGTIQERVKKGLLDITLYRGTNGYKSYIMTENYLGNRESEKIGEVISETIESEKSILKGLMVEDILNSDKDLKLGKFTEKTLLLAERLIDKIGQYFYKDFSMANLAPKVALFSKIEFTGNRISVYADLFEDVLIQAEKIYKYSKMLGESIEGFKQVYLGESGEDIILGNKNFKNSEMLNNSIEGFTAPKNAELGDGIIAERATHEGLLEMIKQFSAKKDILEKYAELIEDMKKGLLGKAGMFIENDFIGDRIINLKSQKFDKIFESEKDKIYGDITKEILSSNKHMKPSSILDFLGEASVVRKKFSILENLYYNATKKMSAFKIPEDLISGDKTIRDAELMKKFMMGIDGTNRYSEMVELMKLAGRESKLSEMIKDTNDWGYKDSDLGILIPKTIKAVGIGSPESLFPEPDINDPDTDLDPLDPSTSVDVPDRFNDKDKPPIQNLYEMIIALDGKDGLVMPANDMANLINNIMGKWVRSNAEGSDAKTFAILSTYYKQFEDETVPNISLADYMSDYVGDSQGINNEILDLVKFISALMEEAQNHLCTQKQTLLEIIDYLKDFESPTSWEDTDFTEGGTITIVPNPPPPDPPEVVYPSTNTWDDVDLTLPSGATAQAINASLNKYGGYLVGIGQACVDVEKLYGVNAWYVASHACWESSWGRSRIAKDKNNLFGYGAYDRSPYKSAWTFATKGDCILKVMKNVARDYLSPKGRYYRNSPTLKGMNVKYATDKNWHNGIAKIMKGLTKINPPNNMIWKGVRTQNVVPANPAPVVDPSTTYAKWYRFLDLESTYVLHTPDRMPSGKNASQTLKKRTKIENSVISFDVAIKGGVPRHEETRVVDGNTYRLDHIDSEFTGRKTITYSSNYNHKVGIQRALWRGKKVTYIPYQPYQPYVPAQPEVPYHPYVPAQLEDIPEVIGHPEQPYQPVTPEKPEVQYVAEVTGHPEILAHPYIPAQPAVKGVPEVPYRPYQPAIPAHYSEGGSFVSFHLNEFTGYRGYPASDYPKPHYTYAPWDTLLDNTTNNFKFWDIFWKDMNNTTLLGDWIPYYSQSCGAVSGLYNHNQSKMFWSELDFKAGGMLKIRYVIRTRKDDLHTTNGLRFWIDDEFIGAINMNKLAEDNRWSFNSNYPDEPFSGHDDIMIPSGKHKIQVSTSFEFDGEFVMIQSIEFFRKESKLIPEVPAVPEQLYVPAIIGHPYIPEQPAQEYVPAVETIPAIPYQPYQPAMPEVPYIPAIEGHPFMPAHPEIPEMPYVPAQPEIPYRAEILEEYIETYTDANLRIYIDGMLLESISYDISDFRKYEITLPSGTHTLRFEYSQAIEDALTGSSVGQVTLFEDVPEFRPHSTMQFDMDNGFRAYATYNNNNIQHYEFPIGASGFHEFKWIFTQWDAPERNVYGQIDNIKITGVDTKYKVYWECPPDTGDDLIDRILEELKDMVDKETETLTPEDMWLFT
jgi:hypothetical protein